MKILNYLILITFFTACANPKDKKGNTIKFNENISEDVSTPFKDTTLVNNKKRFDIKFDSINSEFMALTATCEGKITLIDSIDKQGFGYVDYLDFDKDGDFDILIDYIGNNSTYYLYLFDPLNNKFRNIEGYFNFPESVPLKSAPNYYYSYHRAGCADYNWESDLFRIENFKIIHLGNINGQGCESNLVEEPKVIEIYKVLNNSTENKELIEKLNYQENIPDFDVKWDFIKKITGIRITKNLNKYQLLTAPKNHFALFS